MSLLRVMSAVFLSNIAILDGRKNPHFHFCNIFASYSIAIIYVLTLIIIKCLEI